MAEEYTSPREKGICVDCGKEKWLYEDKYQCTDCLIRANQNAVSDEPLREVPEWVRCSRCNQLTGLKDDDGRCPTCIVKTSNFGKDDISVTASAPGEATVHRPLVDCSHDESVMCRNCHPEAFDNNIEAPTRPGGLNCDVCHGALPAVYRMLSVCEKCEGSNFHETIKAREREADDLRYRVRGLEKENKERRKEVHYRNRALEKVRKERDEWKARAEQAEKEVEWRYQNHMNLMRTFETVRYERDAYKHDMHRAEEQRDELKRERDEWKARAEQAETEHQNALQDGSICPDPDLHKGDTLDGWAASEIGRLQEELEAAKRAQQMTWDALDEEVQGRLRVERENNALHDAVKHLRGQVPDTRWCCYHNRQENHAGEAQE